MYLIWCWHWCWCRCRCSRSSPVQASNHPRHPKHPRYPRHLRHPGHPVIHPLIHILVAVRLFSHIPTYSSHYRHFLHNSIASHTRQPACRRLLCSLIALDTRNRHNRSFLSSCLADTPTYILVSRSISTVIRHQTYLRSSAYAFAGHGAPIAHDTIEPGVSRQLQVLVHSLRLRLRLRFRSHHHRRVPGFVSYTFVASAARRISNQNQQYTYTSPGPKSDFLYSVTLSWSLSGIILLYSSATPDYHQNPAALAPPRLSKPRPSRCSRR